MGLRCSRGGVVVVIYNTTQFGWLVCWLVGLCLILIFSYEYQTEHEIQEVRTYIRVCPSDKAHKTHTHKHGLTKARSQLIYIGNY